MKLVYVPDSSPGALMSSEASSYGVWSSPKSPPTSAARSFASLQFSKPTDSGPNSE